MIRQLITRTDEPVSAPNERVVFTLDASGNIKSLNAAGERLTGYSFEQLRKMNVVEILSAPCAGEIRERVRRSIRNRVGTVFEIEIMTRDGRRLRIETSLNMIRCADGTIEFRGIALPQRDAAATGNGQPQCLDERFAFESSVVGECKVRVRPAR